MKAPSCRSSSRPETIVHDQTDQSHPGAPGTTGWLGALDIAASNGSRRRLARLPAPHSAIGREGDVRLDSARVSRQHATISLGGGVPWLRDTGSVNGTYLNGVRVTRPQQVRDGDHVVFGDVVTTFVASERLGRTSGPATGTGWNGGGEWRAQTETTRYLSAASHLDRRYRGAVLDATVREEQRAVCPSYGVDLSVVARHAVVAERRALVRDAVLTTILGLATVVAAAWVRRPAGGTTFAAWIAVLLVAAVLTVSAEVSVRLTTLGRLLQFGGRPADLRVPGGRTGRILSDLADANDGNVVVFTVFEPFVGSGMIVDSGSFTVPLIPQEEWLEQAPPRVPDPITSGEVLDALSSALVSLREPQLRTGIRLYVNGLDVALLPDLLPRPVSRPRTHASAALIQQLVARPTGFARPYLCAEVTAWRGQLVVTTFIRVVALPGLLYVESSAYVLAPLHPSYYKVDQLRIRTTPERITATIATAAQEAVPAMAAAPIRLISSVRPALAAANQQRVRRRHVADNVLIDYGAVISIREFASGHQFWNRFMAQDVDMYVQVVQQKVVDAIIALLDGRGYQTDKVKQIQNNTNVTFQGGNPNVGAIGTQSHGTVGSGRAAAAQRS
jgi:hypothetical protein